jgi:hypothetical protein
MVDHCTHARNYNDQRLYQVNTRVSLTLSLRAARTMRLWFRVYDAESLANEISDCSKSLYWVPADRKLHAVTDFMMTQGRLLCGAQADCCWSHAKGQPSDVRAITKTAQQEYTVLPHSNLTTHADLQIIFFTSWRTKQELVIWQRQTLEHKTP